MCPDSQTPHPEYIRFGSSRNYCLKVGSTCSPWVSCRCYAMGGSDSGEELGQVARLEVLRGVIFQTPAVKQIDRVGNGRPHDLE